MSSSLSLSPDHTDQGRLKVSLVSAIDHTPLPNGKVSLAYTGFPENTIEEITTNASGQTEILSLSAPPVEYSLSADGEKQPYAEYTISVEVSGFEPVSISGVEILSSATALQTIKLSPTSPVSTGPGVYVIPAHTLYGSYPPKISEKEIKPISETGEIVLSRVVVPEYIVVHDGSPGDSTAKNHYVKYKDYIKNVASNEIYATWPADTIRANILAIMSFTLNRVYTEWYRNKGYDYTITSSTAFDQKWVPERNIYDSISLIVDELFAQYLSRPNVRQPIFAQYCDGKNTTCPNWLSQWGSKSLGDQGFSPLEILRYYYGDTLYINTAEAVSGVPSSWPGFTLSEGSSGDSVLQIQEELNTIADAYPLIPKLSEDGIYGPKTTESVKTFQSIFDLPATGITNYATWYKISEIYVGVARISELS